MKKKIFIVCIWVLTMVFAFYIGGNMEKNIIREKLRSVIDKDFYLNDTIDFSTNAITEDYPNMTKTEKEIWFDKNKEFYEYIDNGRVLISPLQKPYFYADNAGNNLIVTSFINRFYDQYHQVAGYNTIMGLDIYDIHGFIGDSTEEGIADNFDEYIKDFFDNRANLLLGIDKVTYRRKSREKPVILDFHGFFVYGTVAILGLGVARRCRRSPVIVKLQPSGAFSPVTVKRQGVIVKSEPLVLSGLQT
jgi:hypothetical protein